MRSRRVFSQLDWILINRGISGSEVIDVYVDIDVGCLRAQDLFFFLNLLQSFFYFGVL